MHLVRRKQAPRSLRKGREIRGHHVGCTRDGTVYLIHGIRVMHFAVSTSTKFKHRCEATCPGVRA